MPSFPLYAPRRATIATLRAEEGQGGVTGVPRGVLTIIAARFSGVVVNNSRQVRPLALHSARGGPACGESRSLGGW